MILPIREHGTPLHFLVPSLERFLASLLGVLTLPFFSLRLL